LRDWTPVIALAGLAALTVMFAIGVLIGSRGNGQKAAAAAPQVITLQGGGVVPTASKPSAKTASIGSITDNWPSGKSAYTIELRTIPKAGATAASVNTAKSAAAGKGAPSVGVLDAANYNKLGNGYIIYSGVYPTDAKASAVLATVKKAFPSATGVVILRAALEQALPEQLLSCWIAAAPACC
jgi:hypothetical protein